MSLLSCHIIEKDTNGDLLWIWTFPSISGNKKSHINKHYHLDDITGLVYGHYEGHWFYIVSSTETNNIENVENFAVILWANDFKPDMYEKLATYLCKIYAEKATPISVLEVYLKFNLKEVLPNTNGSLILKETLAPNETTLIDLIKLLGLETILIYNAVLLKGRIVFYHHSQSALLELFKVFPSFVPHRKVEDVLYPDIFLNEDIISRKYYVGGCTDNSIFSRTDIFDYLVNLPAKEITTSPFSKDKFPMTKIHKEIALYMEELANSEINDEKLISLIKNKTDDILQNLKSILQNGFLSIKSLKQNNISLGMESFLLRLAYAENIQIIP